MTLSKPLTPLNLSFPSCKWEHRESHLPSSQTCKAERTLCDLNTGKSSTSPLVAWETPFFLPLLHQYFLSSSSRPGSKPTFSRGSLAFKKITLLIPYFSSKVGPGPLLSPRVADLVLGTWGGKGRPGLDLTCLIGMGNSPLSQEVKHWKKRKEK